MKRERERERERNKRAKELAGLGHIDVHKLVLLGHLLDLGQVLDRWGVDQMNVLLNQSLVLGLLTQLVARHPVLVKHTLALGLDFLRTFQGSDRRGHQVPIVTDWNVATLLELEGRVNGHLLASGLAEGLGPADLTGVTLHLEVLVAF